MFAMATESIKINDVKEISGMKFHEVEGGFGEGKKSILAKEIAKIHQRSIGNVNKLINDNRIRFKDNIDIVDLNKEEFAIVLSNSGIYTQNSINASKNIYLLSERGYSKLLKIMDDDLAWKKYNELVDNYFNMRQKIKNDKSKKPRQKKVVKDRIADYTIKGMRRTLENSSYYEIEKNINDIIEYHRNLSINFRDKAYQKEEFKDKTRYVNVIKSKIIKILECIRENNKDFVLHAVISKIIEDLLRELKTSNNISSSIKISNLKNQIEKKDNAIALLNPPMSKFLDLEFYGFSFNDMYHYYKNDKVKRTVEYNNWMFDFPYDKVVASFNDVDLTRPAALFVKYVAPESNDIDNFVKSTQDAVASALGCNDNKIHKINAERIGYCDKIEDGKILVFLRNLTDDEINQNKLI